MLVVTMFMKTRNVVKSKYYTILSAQNHKIAVRYDKRGLTQIMANKTVKGITNQIKLLSYINDSQRPSLIGVTHFETILLSSGA